MMRAVMTLLLLLGWLGGVEARDMPLSEVLIEGEGWQVVSEGHGFTDGLCSDAEGNLYFSDVRSGQVIYKVDLEGLVSEFKEI